MAYAEERPRMPRVKGFRNYCALLHLHACQNLRIRLGMYKYFENFNFNTEPGAALSDGKTCFKIYGEILHRDISRPRFAEVHIYTTERDNESGRSSLWIVVQPVSFYARALYPPWERCLFEDSEKAPPWILSTRERVEIFEELTEMIGEFLAVQALEKEKDTQS